jgi:hypothetical protein
VPVTLRLRLHFQAAQVRYIGAPITADHITAILAHEAVLVPLS